MRDQWNDRIIRIPKSDESKFHTYRSERSFVGWLWCRRQTGSTTMKWFHLWTPTFVSFSSKMSTTPAKRKRNVVAAHAMQEEFRYLEFYSGVGGWRMGLDEALRKANGERHIDKTACVAALDHSDLCLQVYHHNFSPATGDKKPVKACRIEQIKPKQLLDEWRADAWFMSPPCQPHTRQHDKQASDLSDPRSSSFLHICKLLEQDLPADALPTLICLENVVGFAESNSCRAWRQALSKRNYAVARFHWNPTQVNLPNDRPRYFCLAVLQNKLQIPNANWEGLVSVEKDTEQAPVIQTSLAVLNVREESEANSTSLPPIRDFLDADSTQHVVVPDKLLERNASWCFDIVTANSQRSACFTSGYGKFVKGTGSVLYTGDDQQPVNFTLQRPEDRKFEADWAQNLTSGSLRYLSGLEIARLMGFASSFSFPGSCTPKQQWKLVGNSLNVRLAARLITLGLCLCGKLSLEPTAGTSNLAETTSCDKTV